MVKKKKNRKMLTMTYSTDYHDSASKKRNIFYIIKTGKWQMKMLHVQLFKLQGLKHKINQLFYIHYLQIQLEITKDSVGLKMYICVSLNIQNNTCKWFQWDTHSESSCEHANTRVQNVKNSHTRCSRMEWCEGENIFSGCWC